MEEQDPEEIVRDFVRNAKKLTAFCGHLTSLSCKTASGGNLMLLC